MTVLLVIDMQVGLFGEDTPLGMMPRASFVGHDGAGCSESGLRDRGGGGRAHNRGSTARGCRLRYTASQLGVAESDPPEKADQSTSCRQRHWSGRIELAKGGFEPPNNAMNSDNKGRRSFVA